MKFSLLLISLIAVGECCLAQKPANKTVSSTEKIEIEKLIEQLGSSSFQERRDASQKLMRKGETILPILKDALTSRDPETRKRLESLIKKISVFETEKILKQLVKNPDSIPKGRLPFLSEYTKLIGKDTISLEFYAAMYRREKNLFHHKLIGTKFRTAVEERIEIFYQSVKGRIRVGDHHGTASLCAFFFLLSETKPIILHKSNLHLYTLAYHGSLPNTLSRRNESPEKKIIALWIQNGISAHPYQKASLALEFNLKEGLEASLVMLKNRMKSGTHITSALSVIAKFGSVSHVTQLEERFDDETKISGRQGNGAPDTYECLTKDFALLAAILVSKQKPEAYGFRQLWKNSTGFYDRSSAGFDTEEDRKKAFEKWNVWKKQNNQSTQKIELASLIEQLGSSSFRERRNASRKLMSKGSSILPVLQNESINRSTEVRKRLESLIRDIRLAETEKILQQLVEKPDSIPNERLPFLREFRESIGKDKESLKFYCAMYRGQTELFHLHREKKKYDTRTEEAIGELYENYRENNRSTDKNLTARICAVFFLQSVTKPQISRNMHSYLYSLSYYQDLQQTLRSKKDSPERKVIALWIRKGISAYPYQKAMLALQYDFKEGLEPSLEMLEDRAQTGSMLMYPLFVVAKYGSKKHIPILEKRFGDDREQSGFRGNEAPESYLCLNKDSALLGAVLISKQKPEDYGFQRLQKNSIYLYNPGSTGFDTEEDRKTAFEKWKTWKKKNKPAQSKK